MPGIRPARARGPREASAWIAARQRIQIRDRGGQVPEAAPLEAVEQRLLLLSLPGGSSAGNIVMVAAYNLLLALPHQDLDANPPQTPIAHINGVVVHAIHRATKPTATLSGAAAGTAVPKKCRERVPRPSHLAPHEVRADRGGEDVPVAWWLRGRCSCYCRRRGAGSVPSPREAPALLVRRHGQAACLGGGDSCGGRGVSSI
jgi:hypothetical protein